MPINDTFSVVIFLVAFREPNGCGPFMIKNFSHKGLEKFFTTESKAGIQARHAKRIRLILAQLNQAKTVEDMNIPTLALHQLKGNRKRVWAVTVQANWRITFRFIEGDAEIVNYEDYH